MRRTHALMVAMALAGCAGGDPVDTAPPAPSRAQGPRVVWDLAARPFPEVPLPNDVATFPDAHSPTGMRLNVAAVAPTAFERTARAGYDSLDGWGTFAPVTVSFDDDVDLANLTRRMRGDDHEFRDDAVYVIDLSTGVPVPLDLGDGAFVYTLKNRDGYYPNDPRGAESNLLFETVDEDTNHNGALDPGEDTNFDGRLNRAAVFPAGARPEDALTPFWVPDTRTLILRPLLPLRERTSYAVVLTDRLTDRAGRPVRSPFPTVAHAGQAQRLDALDALVRARPAYYGDLAYRPRASDPAGASRVVFAWAFTTQSTTSELLALRDGLHGTGVFAPTVGAVPPDLRPARVTAGSTTCRTDQTDRPFVVRGQALRDLVSNLARAVNLGDAQREALEAQYRYVDHVVLGTFRTPYLMGDPGDTDVTARWSINPRTGAVEHLGEDTVQFALAVPKALDGRHAPFPVAFYGHGYTGNLLDALGFAGDFAAQGIAVAGINASGHGLVLEPTQRLAVTALLRGLCLSGLAEPLFGGRARDLNGDLLPDSGGDFWTAYVFHTRDHVRQSVLDHMQLIRAMQGFDGRAQSADDTNHDGVANDLAGDFDGDGVVDVGGPDARFFATGGSLGGALSMILGGADAAVRAAAPISGGGGLTDVGIRSTQGGIREAVLLRLMGPLLVTVPWRDLAPVDGVSRTSCATGQTSLRFLVPDVNDTGALEVACLDIGDAPPSDGAPIPAVASGDDVVVTRLSTGEVRCARAGDDGRFRVGIPADGGDRLVVTVMRGHAVTDFGTCALRDDAAINSQIDAFQVFEGDCGVGCGHIPPQASPDSPARRYRRPTNGEALPLTAPAEGMGLRRQSPELLRFMLLAQAALDAGDPINFASLYLLRRPATHPRHALLVLDTAGDSSVPVNTGNAFARAAGVIPFLRGDAAGRFAEYADFVTPTALAQRYGATPDRVLADHFVYEGIASLDRYRDAMGAPALFDVDDLDEGRAMFGEPNLMPPLRLVRRASSVTNGVDDAWAPTGAAWQSNLGPLAAVLNAYLRPTGTHSFGAPDPRQPWDASTYLITTIARFFATDGEDLLYRSLPEGHGCAASGRCEFLPARPDTQ